MAFLDGQYVKGKDFVNSSYPKFVFKPDKTTELVFDFFQLNLLTTPEELLIFEPVAGQDLWLLGDFLISYKNNKYGNLIIKYNYYPGGAG